MSIKDKAVQWAIGVAEDNSHGYDQSSRWGPDYDCSSFVISAFKQAGVPLTCTYTGNMKYDMLSKGFVLANVDFKTGANLKKGDVLLNEKQHTALYIGDGKIVHATGNESGKVTGGKTGDQTGKEIVIANYYNANWEYCLRYSGKTQESALPPGSYVVQKGDSLWSIAERLLGAGERYIQIMTANNMADSLIYPGEVLIIPKGDVSYKTINITINNDTYDLLRIMAEGWNKTIGQVIDELMADAV